MNLEIYTDIDDIPDQLRKDLKKAGFIIEDLDYLVISDKEITEIPFWKVFRNAFDEDYAKSMIFWDGRGHFRNRYALMVQH